MNNGKWGESSSYKRFNGSPLFFMAASYIRFDMFINAILHHHQK